MGVLMKCGCVSQGTFDGKPVCVSCFGLRPGADEISDEQPSLDGRTSVCVECKKETASATSLPFFCHDKGREYDTHYCGCRGWN